MHILHKFSLGVAAGVAVLAIVAYVLITADQHPIGTPVISIADLLKPKCVKSAVLVAANDFYDGAILKGDLLIVIGTSKELYGIEDIWTSVRSWDYEPIVQAINANFGDVLCCVRHHTWVGWFQDGTFCLPMV